MFLSGVRESFVERQQRREFLLEDRAWRRVSGIREVLNEPCLESGFHATQRVTGGKLVAHTFVVAIDLEAGILDRTVETCSAAPELPQFGPAVRMPPPAQAMSARLTATRQSY
jgi:hypothetical protein